MNVKTLREQTFEGPKRRYEDNDKADLNSIAMGEERIHVVGDKHKWSIF